MWKAYGTFSLLFITGLWRKLSNEILTSSSTILFRYPGLVWELALVGSFSCLSFTNRGWSSKLGRRREFSSDLSDPFWPRPEASANSIRGPSDNENHRRKIVTGASPPPHVISRRSGLSFSSILTSRLHEGICCDLKCELKQKRIFKWREFGECYFFCRKQCSI